MARPKATNPDFLNGVPELLLLRLLARQPMHGYELVRSIKLTSGEQFDFGEGCVYPILHRLERNGMLATFREKTGNRTRIVYSVTAAGKGRLAEMTASWEAVVRGIDRVLQGGNDAEPLMA